MDAGELADDAETVGVELKGVTDALATGNVDGAKSEAHSAASGLRTIAALVGPVAPDAATHFLTAAGALDTATSQFPGGLSSLDQAKKEFETGYELARAVRCP